MIVHKTLGDELDGVPTDEETTVHLGLMSDANRFDRVDSLRVPTIRYPDHEGH